MGVNRILCKGKKQQAGNGVWNWEGEEVLLTPMGVTKAKNPHPLWGWRHAKTQGFVSQGW